LDNLVCKVEVEVVEMKKLGSAIRWLVSLILLLFVIVSFSQKGGWVSGFLFLVITVIVNPIFAKILKKSGRKLKKRVTIPLVIVLVFGAFIVFPTTELPNNEGVIEENTIDSENNGKDVVDRNLNSVLDDSIDEIEKIILEQSVQEQTEQEQLVQESVEQEQLEKERLKQESLEQERLEQERLKQESLEQERLEQERLEQERLEQERLKQERLEQERLEQERLEQERLEQERLEQEMIERELLTQTQIEKEEEDNRGNSYNFDTYNIPEQQNTTASYVLNVNSKKIHHSSCKDVKKIKPENYLESNSTLSELESQGYTTCGHCFK
jgi:hypothetical protein